MRRWGRQLLLALGLFAVAASCHAASEIKTYAAYLERDVDDLLEFVADDLGGDVHQMSSNFQMRDDGGEGYLRIIEVLPDGRTVRVRTYSPILDVWLAGAEHNLVFELEGPERRPA